MLCGATTAACAASPNASTMNAAASTRPTAAMSVRRLSAPPAPGGLALEKKDPPGAPIRRPVYPAPARRR
jgi:hypothetical protein